MSTKALPNGLPSSFEEKPVSSGSKLEKIAAKALVAEPSAVIERRNKKRILPMEIGDDVAPIPAEDETIAVFDKERESPR